MNLDFPTVGLERFTDFRFGVDLDFDFGVDFGVDFVCDFDFRFVFFFAIAWIRSDRIDALS